MTNIGIIGFGSMGSMLANGLLSSNAVQQGQLFAYSRSMNKVEAFRETHRAIRTCESCSDVVRKSDCIFICAPPNQVKPILLEIKDAMTEDKHLVSIAAYVSIANMESILHGQISKVIPSFVSSVNEGVFLACHNEKVTDGSKERLSAALGALGVIREIDESQFEVYSDITSCSPGIFSSLFSEFIDSACRRGNVDRDDALAMFTQTLYGLSKVYKERNVGFDETIKRVARKGGITEIGIAVVREKAPSLFDEIFEKTLAKHETRKQEFMKEFG